MSPTGPPSEVGPLTQAAATGTPNTASVQANDDAMPVFEPKAGGIIRVNRARTVEARCVDCSAFFGSTGPAASHSRSARHRVAVDYRTEFVFAPSELLDRAR